MRGAFDDVQILVLAGRTLVEILAHPARARFAAGDDLQQLGEEDLDVMKGVVGGQLRKAADRRNAGRVGTLPARCVVVLLGACPNIHL